MDPKGFFAPYGPTFAEQRHPGFKISYERAECQWNGPSWPMATSSVLTGLANLLNNYEQDTIDNHAYFETLKIYTQCHQRKREDGKVVPWIDENINPYTGDWIARTRLKEWENGTWSKKKGGKERGKDYNHSSYNDLIISGLVGLRPRLDDTVEVNPLLPENTWDYFCLDNILYHGEILTIIWDKTGKKYGKGKGLIVLANGTKIAGAPTLTKVTGKLPIKIFGVRASHTYKNDTVDCLIQSGKPKHSFDVSIKRWTSWPQVSETQWIEYDLGSKKKSTLSGCSGFRTEAECMCLHHGMLKFQTMQMDRG